MKRKLGSVLLTLAMVLSLLNAAAIPARATDNYALWVAGTQVTSDNADNITTAINDAAAAAGTITYDAATKTLTLSGAMITGDTAARVHECSAGESANYQHTSYAAIYSEIDGLTIAVTDDSTVNAAYRQNHTNLFGICSKDAALTVTVAAGKTLTVESGNFTDPPDSAYYSCGIYLQDLSSTVTDRKALTFDGAGTVLATGSVTGHSGNGGLEGVGIWSMGPMSVSAGTVTATGRVAFEDQEQAYVFGYGVKCSGLLTVSGGARLTGQVKGVGNDVIAHTKDKQYAYTRGIAAWNRVDISGDGTEVTGTGASHNFGAYAVSTSNNSCGAYFSASASNPSVISGGTVTGTGGDSAYSCGIELSGGMTISGGTVTAAGGAAADAGNGYSEASRGIQNGGRLTISGGTVTATAGSVSGDYGKSVGFEGRLLLTGGSLSATAGNVAGDNGESYGCYCDSNNVEITVSGAGKLTATAGGATGESGISAGIYSKYDTTPLTFGSSDDASVTATAGAATDSYGIYSEGAVTVSDGVVTATGGNASGTVSSGLFVNGSGKTLAANGGKLVCRAGNAAGGSGSVQGLYVRGAMTVAAGAEVDVDVSGTAASGGNWAVRPGTLTVSGGTMTAVAGTSSGGGSYGVEAGTLTFGDGVIAVGGASSESATSVTAAQITASPASYPYVKTTQGRVVSFAANGGTGTMTPVSVATGSSYTLPDSTFAPPAGMVFKAWQIGSAQYAPGDAVTVSANTTVAAVWAWTVTFSADGGTPVPAGQSVEDGGKVAQPAAMAKTNYGFGGWYTDAALTSAWDFANDTVTANMTLYAKWNINAHTVTFDANGGAPVPAAQSVAHGGKASEPTPAPSKANNSFAGWYSDAALTSAWNFGVYTVTADVTLYAKWTLNAHTVTFDANGGAPVPAAQSVAHGGKASEPAPAPSKAGSSFAGWFSDAALTSAWDFGVYTVMADTTLYAKWTPVHTSGGGGGGSSATTTTTTTTEGTSNADSSATDGRTTTSTTKNPDGSTTVKITQTGTTDAADGGKVETRVESTTNTRTSGGTTTATTTSVKTDTTTAADGVRTVTETKTTSTETLDSSGSGTIKSTVTETVRDASGKVAATTVIESAGTVTTAAGGARTTVTTNTATTTDAAGAVTRTVTTETAVELSDGSTGRTVSDESGNVVAVEAKISEKAIKTAAQNNEAVTLAVGAAAATATTGAAPVEITVPRDTQSFLVAIPVENVTPSTVPVLIKPDGTEEIVKFSAATEDAVVLALDAGATIKLVDNAKSFIDVKGSEWFAGSVAWASSREIMNGTLDGFEPNLSTSRAMVAQLLYNLDGGKLNAAGGMSFRDVSGGDWFAPAIAWATANGVAQGQGDIFGATESISREQLAVMLYNYARLRGCDVSASASLQGFADASGVSGWAQTAMQWAVGAGIIGGTTDARGNVILGAQGVATRAQVAAMIQRFCEKVAM